MTGDEGKTGWFQCDSAFSEGNENTATITLSAKLEEFSEKQRLLYQWNNFWACVVEIFGGSAHHGTFKQVQLTYMRSWRGEWGEGIYSKGMY